MLTNIFDTESVGSSMKLHCQAPQLQQARLLSVRSATTSAWLFCLPIQKLIEEHIDFGFISK